MENKKILIKRICSLFAILLLFVQETKGQDTVQKKYDYHYEEIDSALLMGKAKLLCLSKFGIDDIDSIYTHVLLQESHIFRTVDQFYDVITIKSNQNFSTRVKTKTGRGTLYCGEDFDDNSPCYYTVVFSYHSYRFYLLSGFTENEIKKLDEEMTKYAVNIYDIFSDELIKQLPIDFDCLAAKHLYKDNKYKDRKCYKECGKCMEMAEVN